MAGSGMNDDDSGHELIVELAETVTSDADAASTAVTCVVGGRNESPAKTLLAIQLPVYLMKSKNKTLDCPVPVCGGSLTVKSTLEYHSWRISCSEIRITVISNGSCDIYPCSTKHPCSPFSHPKTSDCQLLC